MIIGFILRKTNIISTEVRKAFTDVVIYLILPANIIHSFEIDISWSILQSGIYVFIISIIIQLLAQVSSRILYPFADKKQYPVLSYATICSNAGFMGNPLIEGIYGSTGLLFASIYLIPQRIVMWSLGIACFSGQKGKNVLKRVITHPCIIAVFIGLFIMIFQIPILSPIDKTLSALSNCTTAMSMLVIGGILAEIDFKSVFSKVSFYYCFIRLILIPAIVFFGCYICKMPSLVCGVCSVLAGMPAGTTTAILAEKYDSDSHLAVQLVFLSTTLSLITIPLLTLFIENFF
jgi:hypothetical protein